jgi:hypothetical protein
VACLAVEHNRSITFKQFKEFAMHIVRRWAKPALIVIAAIAAAATLSGSVPATAHARATTGAQAHARAAAPVAHARSVTTLA